MAIFKCKMCGGALDVSVGTTIIECEYCGTNQTLPRLDDEKRANLYDRANHFRRSNEFDKAMTIYEQILNEDNTDAEAYWSLVLCRYGIEYVEDPATRKRIPTVNRAQFTSIFDDNNYKAAIEHADPYQKAIYEEEARAINEIQKGILAISEKEEPFDVFICYKETDANGRRTPDSVLAQELYYQLKQEGFKVFFSRITLEDKLGSAYEPYIFAALNSAKVMVVLGTKPEYFNAVWVKNEWSRYLALIKQGQRKMLIPAYKDMDPYNLPEEFSHLQAQDMSKLGFMQDLIRGIKKIIGNDRSTVAPIKVEPKVEEKSTAKFVADIDPILFRAKLFLEDGDWTSANEYADKVLDAVPTCSEAYIVKLLIDLKLNTEDALDKYDRPIKDNPNYKKAVRFATPEVAARLEAHSSAVENNIKQARFASTYAKAVKLMKNAESPIDFRNASKLFISISEYKNAKELAVQCDIKATEIIEKQKKRKKVLIITCIAVVAIIFIVIGITIANHNKNEKMRGDLNLQLNDDKTGYVVKAADKKYSGDIVIPAEYKGKPVVEIDERAFYNCDGLTSVTIPDSVTYIGYGAFYYCENLTSVTIGNGVTSIGYYAFYNCVGLTSITIPDGVTSIGDSAFEGCYNLTSITISDTVTSIGKWAFYRCFNIYHINYRGTQSQWNAISKDAYWFPNAGSYTFTYNYTGE